MSAFPGVARWRDRSDPCRWHAGGGSMPFYDTDAETESIGRELVQRSLQAFASRGLDAGHFSVTLLRHDRPLGAGGPSPLRPRGFGYRSSQPYYPCSVVKLFYLVAAQ